jgi:hypothetical protein
LAGTLQDMLDWWRRRLCCCPYDPECSKQVRASSGAISLDSAIGAE